MSITLQNELIYYIGTAVVVISFLAACFIISSYFDVLYNAIKTRPAQFQYRIASTPVSQSFYFGDKKNINPVDLPSDETWRQSISELITYVKHENPDWIIGVHPGGRILSTFVADQLNFPTHHVKFAHTEPESYLSISIRDVNEISGKVLVVDDITRTGTTLRAVRSKIVESVRPNFVNNSLRVAVLAIVNAFEDKDAVISPFSPHWFWMATDYKYLELPWSKLSDKIKSSYNNNQKGVDHPEYFIKLHEKMATDFEFSLSIAKLCMDDYDSFEEHIDQELWNI